MDRDSINLDFSKLLGFRLTTSHEDHNSQPASHFTKVGRKPVSEKSSIGKINAKVGAKVGVKKV